MLWREVLDVLGGEGVAAVELFELFADGGFGAAGVEAKGLFEPILSHGEVGDGGPLFFVEEVVIGDGEEGHFVDRLEGGLCVEVDAASHQLLEGFVVGGHVNDGGADGLGSKHACCSIVVTAVYGHVGMFVAFCSRVKIEVCSALGDL